MTGRERPGFEGYVEVRRAAAVAHGPAGGLLAVGGRDAVSFLQGVLTNDVASLAPGQGCYAASLTAQGRMVSDMHVLRGERDVLLVVEPPVAAALAARFDQSIFTEDVLIEDRSDVTASIAVHGPDAAVAVAAGCDARDRAALIASLAPGRHASIPGASGEMLAFGGSWLGVPGIRILGPEPDVRALAERLGAAGVPLLGAAALDARRIEAGTPLFGVDLSSDTIPLEAGLERAISTTKGCYVGQEIIVRILHRAHGRVARRLVGLVAAQAGLAAGRSVFADGREVGTVTSAAWSPELSAEIALAIVHKDACDAGTRVAIGGPSGPHATVRDLPLLPPHAT